MAFDTSMNWHYVKNGEAAGPVPGAELQRLAAEGGIRPTTLIWNPTLPNWIEAASFTDLFPAAAPPPPPIPLPGSTITVEPNPPPQQPVAAPAAFADLGPELGAPHQGRTGNWSSASLEPDGDALYEAEPEVRYAGFWIRVVAYVLDAVILAALTWATIEFTTIDNDLSPALAGLLPMDQIDLAIAWLEQNNVRYLTREMVQLNAASTAISAVLTVLYFVLLQWILQGTLGKLIVGIRLRKKNGDNVGFVRMLWRYIMTFISAAILMIGYLMAGFTREKTALHDILAGTRVVYRKP